MGATSMTKIPIVYVACLFAVTGSNEPQPMLGAWKAYWLAFGLTLLNKQLFFLIRGGCFLFFLKGFFFSLFIMVLMSGPNMAYIASKTPKTNKSVLLLCSAFLLCRMFCVAGLDIFLQWPCQIILPNFTSLLYFWIFWLSVPQPWFCIVSIVSLSASPTSPSVGRVMCITESTQLSDLLRGRNIEIFQMWGCQLIVNDGAVSIAQGSSMPGVHRLLLRSLAAGLPRIFLSGWCHGFRLS